VFILADDMGYGDFQAAAGDRDPRLKKQTAVPS